jgi:RNA-splicing ligase RtcB
MTDTVFTGKDLIDMGYKPAPWFGDALGEINAKQMSVSQAHRHCTAIVDAIEAAEAERLARQMPLHPVHAPFTFSLTATTEDEISNAAAVRATMEGLLRTPVLERGAVMPDACPAGPMGTIPVGGVVAARNAILPGAHSADICCSLFATQFDDADPKAVLDAVHAATHFGPGGRKRHEEYKISMDLLERFKNHDMLNNGKLLGAARSHMGTQGDGNHFAFVGVSEQTGKTTLVTHHGSRGVGAQLYKIGMAIAEEFRLNLSPETLKENAWIPADSPEGIAYWEALQILRDWTRENHRVLHDAALESLGCGIHDRFWNEHNFVFREEDADYAEKGAVFWHAKGATPIHNPLLPDTAGTQIVPLNMSQPILFVQGTRNDTNLGFAPHGAGRNMSRTQHKKLHAGRTNEEVFAEETAGIDARFFCGITDISELPSAYKDADAVQADMEKFDLARIVDRIMPYGAIMAGDCDQDAPWKVKARAKRAAREKSGVATN